MRAQLLILKRDPARVYSNAKHLRFAVVDLDRGDYPLNFVCMLPLRFSFKENRCTMFERTFGKNSFSLAKKLLSDASKSEADEEVKAEIVRRLKLLDHESVGEKNCVGCGVVFEVDPKKKLRQRFCENCLRKKFGGRP